MFMISANLAAPPSMTRQPAPLNRPVKGGPHSTGPGAPSQGLLYDDYIVVFWISYRGACTTAGLYVADNGTSGH
ncbi:hypothetical protein N7539_007190 [Penicillium diatomitis]|uniref:Uncharacterized protein n=1 Tax=Penicillium diatomitis TaxID=2819901 RepID=A0A9W9WVI3_9EURO|nr:uncharacterized protein N7539_007190 [Penicillium diatomitis]KAJ5477046.1 hypothetical protein N7539_007190 [Penicillium diatomitis]